MKKQRVSVPQVAMNDVTRILSAIEQGDSNSAAKLLPLVYDELRKLAAARMANESPDQTLQATALVHEAYLRLVGNAAQQHWNSRGHFFGAAAEAMRRILVDQARRKLGPKAGGHLQRVGLEHADPSCAGPDLDILALNEALDKLAAKDPRKAELVKLRYFAGLTTDQAALALGVAPSTVDLDWAYAKSWLRAEMSGDAASNGDA
jgi:RNA polymerase sigma factor (TIGR02999 family)